MQSTLIIDSHPLAISGRFPRIAHLRDEFYDHIQSPEQFVAQLEIARIPADIFTFILPVSLHSPTFDYHSESEGAAVLRISTYDHWWKKQINDKTRNMIRKAAKSGVEIRAVEFDDDLVRQIVRIHNETPIRQGRPFKHYGKSFEATKAGHATFLDRSEFFGAYLKNELIGFIKLVHGEGASNLMQIISLIAHRDKAPTNALIAKAVERCAARAVPLLHYGTWSRRSMGEFKRHHAFERVEIPRFYVPLTLPGRAIISLGLHRNIIDMLPEAWVDRAVAWRARLNTKRFQPGKSIGAVAQLAERHS